jgi:hypothetical protein
VILEPQERFSDTLLALKLYEEELHLFEQPNLEKSLIPVPLLETYLPLKPLIVAQEGEAVFFDFILVILCGLKQAGDGLMEEGEATGDSLLDVFEDVKDGLFQPGVTGSISLLEYVELGLDVFGGNELGVALVADLYHLVPHQFSGLVPSRLTVLASFRVFGLQDYVEVGAREGGEVLPYFSDIIDVLFDLLVIQAGEKARSYIVGEVLGVGMVKFVDDEADRRSNTVGFWEHFAEGLHHFEVVVVDLELASFSRGHVDHDHEPHFLQAAGDCLYVVEVYQLPEAGVVGIPRHVHHHVVVGLGPWLKVVGSFGDGGQSVGYVGPELLADRLELDCICGPLELELHLAPCGCAGEGGFADSGVSNDDDSFGLLVLEEGFCLLESLGKVLVVLLLSWL